MGLFNFLKDIYIDTDKIIALNANTEVKKLDDNNLANFTRLLYYLDKSFEINYDEITHELATLYNGENKISKDPKYFNMKEKLNKVKQVIFDNTNNLSNNNIELSKQGLDLSIELCNYCIKMNYITSMFVISETKGYFDFFSEQLEHWKMFNPYNKALQYEQQGYFEEAIGLYLYILRNNTPIGTAYYTNPFNLSINLFNYADALEVYKHLKENYIKNKVENLKNIYESYSNKINLLTSYENNYSIIKSKIINILESNPGILQTDLYSKIDSNYKESLRFILYNYEKLNIVKREKSGRTYKIYLV